MKSIIIALSILMAISSNKEHVNKFDYDQAWEMVEKFIAEGLPKSALEKVEEIHQAALTEKNNSQFVKSIIYISRLAIITDEKGIETSIERLENIIKSNTNNVKEITASYLAELYQRYFDMNRYNISQRSEMTSEKGADFRTWTTQNFLSTITSYYLMSLNNQETINIPIKEYSAILNTYDDAAIVFRPTLYEALADRAISFFNNNDASLPQNESSFTISDKAYFEPDKKFIDLVIKTSDQSSSEYRILTIYQNLIKEQLKSGNKQALADYDLKRLAYVFANATVESKNDLYQTSLKNLAETHQNHDYYTEIIYVLAGTMLSDDKDTLANVKAMGLCRDAIKKFPLSSGASKCTSIINRITKPTIQLYAEQVYASKNNILLAVDYNNVAILELSVVKLDKAYEEVNKLNDLQQMLDYLTKAKKVSTSSHKLKANKTYKSQKTELYIPVLPYGQYVILATASTSEKTEKVHQYTLCIVSDLSYTTFLSDKKRHFLVNDRLSGKTLANVDIQLYTQDYNPGTRSYIFNKAGDYRTNKDGVVTMPATETRNFKVVLTYKKDVLNLHNFHGNYEQYEQQENSFAEIFTDRSIYRPGQIIYFKTILLKQDKHQVPAILSNQTVDIILRDANYQEIGKQRLTSNAFGSVNGSFSLPLGKLNGNFLIECSSSDGINGNKNILVEEYKRPTFEVKTDDVKQEFKLNETIKLSGQALTFAGSVVDGAKVSYKVVRSARFPCWAWYWRMPYPGGNEFIISQGETLTDTEGKYSFSFNALPDLLIDKADLPVFNYRVDINVTDQRGETRNANTSVSVGYTAYTLGSSLPQEVDIQTIKELKITATNSNGQPVPATGKVKIIRLKEPKTVQINKYWDGNIDVPIPFSQHDKMFPQYPYIVQNDYSKWPALQTVLDTNFDTKDSIQLKKILEAGVYRIEAEAADKDKNKIKYTTYVVVTNFAKKEFPKSDFLFMSANKEIIEPGATYQLQLGASDKPVYAQVLMEKNGKILQKSIVKIDKTSQINLPVTEALRGGFNVKLSYIMQNRSFEKSMYISVPWTNKQLDITFETFRDKTLPGSKEEYRIKIKGQKQDKIAAEMVAAMYDASLDQFVSNTWRSDFYPTSYASIYLEVPGFQMTQGMYYFYGNEGNVEIKNLVYPALIDLLENYGYYGGGRGDVVMMKSMQSSAPQAAPEAAMDETKMGGMAQTKNGGIDKKPADEKIIKKEKADFPIRKNLKETVFFFPELRTDSDGNIILAFTMNEALTKWRLLSFAHTKDFMTGYDERFVQTQKNLMVFPNAPRFVRDGDVIDFSTKVSNLSEGPLNGTSTLTILDAITLKDITSELIKGSNSRNFTVAKGRSEGLSWQLVIPDASYSAITYRVSAEAGAHTDAEENTIPVVTNRMLVTESMPMWLKGNEARTFVFNAFKNNTSLTKKDYKYTFEYTSNPVWYAIQALPYLNATNNAGTQAIIDRFYANALASKIANAHPKIKAVFDQWKTVQKDALLSNLSKNQELKSALIEETPWLMQSLSEAEQKRNIAVLFDLNTLADDRANTINKLQERQLSNGGFPWFAGGKDDVYTTQNIMENIGHLYHLKALEINDDQLSNLVSRGLSYMDAELTTRYQRLQENIKRYGGNINDDHLDDLSVHYLYIKTFFKHVNAQPSSKEAYNYYYGQTKKYWLKRSLYTQAMIGLILFRNGDNTVNNIIKSLREKSFNNEELGMYWNEGNGFYWYQLPIERHALMIELFTEAASDKTEADRMKIWLLKNKQTTNWKTSKSTSAAIYALLLQGESGDISQWVTENVAPEITIGTEPIKKDPRDIEAGTGYFKKTYVSTSITKDMATIKIKNDNKSIAWGAAYYQYFEQLDQIKTFADTPLKLNKKLFKVISTLKGDQIAEITPDTQLKPGDKLKVRIELRVDREMEYVHMKDMRASGFEPINVISEYKYQGQLGYYETTKDLATHFYFSYLPKGTFVFEYPMTVVHHGDFSGGITSIESMYAPEFSSHSEGLRIKIKDK